MKIEEKVVTTITTELTRSELEYLRDLTQNHLAPAGETEDFIDQELRKGIFIAINNYLNKPTPRGKLK